MGASTNPLCDDKNRLSVCISGQVALSILMNELRKVPTLKLVSLNTDSIQFEINEDKVLLAEEVLNHWQNQYRLELERDDVVKLVMRDINNYCTILETSKGKEVKFKGSCFAACPKIIIDENNKIITKYEPKFKSNNLVIVSEALIKYLLFNIPIEKTIMNCNDIRKYMIISHLGSTYEKCVQESPDGDIILQRNNRIYAGKKPSGLIVKVKPNGRRDSLANCPPNPIVDNANKCTIDDINKQWYIKLAKQWANDFKGVRRLEDYKKEELLEKATSLGLEVDKKIKKADLIKLIEDEIESREINGEPPINPWETEENEEMKKDNVTIKDLSNMNIYQRINEIKKDIMKTDFIMDCNMPGNLGGREYASIGQYYKTINDLSIRYRLLFTWEAMDIESCERDLFKPQGKPPHHVWSVCCRAEFINIDCPDEKVSYYTYANGSDICDKGISGASSLAFRNWFDKNFTPKYLVLDEFGGTENEVSETTEQTNAPKIPTYIPPEKKVELTQTVVTEKQIENNENEDVKKVVAKIMEVRKLTGNQEWGASTLQKIYMNEITSEDLVSIELKVDNKLDSLKGE